MNITEEIVELLDSGDRVASVELTYKNGGKVLGTIRKMRRSPLKVVILKSDPQKGESPKHRVVFDHVTELRVNMADGSEKRFS
jgi:hypothetical protein